MYETLLPLYFNEAEVHKLFVIPKIKDADLRLLSFTTDLVQVLNLETISYFGYFDAFCYHNTQFCMTCSHEKTLGVQIIVAPTVHGQVLPKPMYSTEST